ncbi:MAG: SoxR reducing system RseC family protein [Clostridia bacterium]|nr:SoxR reducing system RseC family protein [Clostridia bacterium]
MVETGVVHKIKGSFATVRFERKTACEKCNMCFKPKEEMYVELRVKNVLQAKVGDKVTVKMGERAVLTASFLVYGLPVIVMALALVLTYKLDIGICLGVSLGSLVLSFIGIALIDRFIIRKKKEYMPIMSSIITENNEEIQ